MSQKIKKWSYKLAGEKHTYVYGYSFVGTDDEWEEFREKIEKRGEIILDLKIEKPTKSDLEIFEVNHE